MIVLKLIYRIYYYLKYYLKAKSIHKVDSPVLYTIFKEILDDNRQYYAFARIQQLRNTISQNHTYFTRTDMGASTQTAKTTPAVLLKQSAIGRAKGEMLFRIIKWFKPNAILELGTNLGISAAYMASVNTDTRVKTLEGDPYLVNLAKEHFNILELNNIEVIEGDFLKSLGEIVHKNEVYDVFYVDGNHSKTPTLQYLDSILKLSTQKYLIIFDDIYWSKEMAETWNLIKSKNNFNLVLDLYHWGIVAYIPDLKATINETLISSKYKYFSLGLFR